MEKKIIKKEKLTESDEKLNSIVDSSVIAGVCATLAVMFGFEGLRSIRYEEYIGKIIACGIGFTTFTLLTLVERENILNKKKSFNRLLKKKNNNNNN